MILHSDRPQLLMFMLTEPIFLVGIQTLGKNVVVAGRSKNVGMPIAMLLHTDGRHERPGGESVWRAEAKQKHLYAVLMSFGSRM